jgi:hypothetical protein
MKLNVHAGRDGIDGNHIVPLYIACAEEDGTSHSEQLSDKQAKRSY